MPIFRELVVVERCFTGINGSEVQVYIWVIGSEKLVERHRGVGRKIFVQLRDESNSFGKIHIVSISKRYNKCEYRY